MPSPEAHTGTLFYTGTPPAGCTAAATPGQCTVTVDLNAKAYLALYPTPQSCGANVCPLTFTGQQVVSENFVTTRIDQKFSDKDSLFGTYMFDRTPFSAPDSFGNVLLSNLVSRDIASVEETQMFSPTLVNSVRFGFNHEAVDDNKSTKALTTAAGLAALGAFPNRDAAFVHIIGETDMPGGVGGPSTYLYRWNS